MSIQHVPLLAVEDPFLGPWDSSPEKKETVFSVGDFGIHNRVQNTYRLEKTENTYPFEISTYNIS